MTRLVKAFRLHGAFGLISKKRGKPSNRKGSKNSIKLPHPSI